MVGMLMKITRGEIMAQPEQLRDWKPAYGFPTSGLSERRELLPPHAARRTAKLEY